MRTTSPLDGPNTTTRRADGTAISSPHAGMFQFRNLHTVQVGLAFCLISCEGQCQCTCCFFSPVHSTALQVLLVCKFGE